MASLESGRERKGLKMRKPAKVRVAIATGNIAALSEMGRRGSEVRRERRANEEEVRAYYAEKEAAQDQVLRMQANEHIIPLDQEEEAA